MSPSSSERLFIEGQSCWPGLTVAREAFDDFMASRSGPGLKAEPADLYLACACLNGPSHDAAMGRFADAYLADLGRVLARLRLDAARVEEVRAELLRLLFVASPGQRPKLASYRGESSLKSWVRTLALHAALRFERRPRVEVAEQTLAAGVALEDDAELAYLKSKCQAEFKAAFRHAVKNLSSRERNLLRQHLLHGLSFEQLAALYAVHRATVVRWVGAARRQLADDVRAELKERLDLNRSEMSRVLRLVVSRLDMSFRELES
jgi:RNA polymerase sigma-70 factor (ECF subfamily)